jgi:hypothetical protein
MKCSLNCVVCLIGALVIGVAYSGRAEEAAEEPEPTGKFADMVRGERNRAKYIREDFAGLFANLAQYDGFVKDDIVLAGRAVEEVIALLAKSARAWAREDEAEGKRLRAEVEKAERVANVWRVRLWEWRRRQAEAAPGEAWFRESLRWVRPGAVPELSALVAAKKSTAEAWGKMAEATVPGADEKVLNAIKEDAFTADAHREIAEWRFNWARQREEIWYEKAVMSPELQEKLAAMRKLQDERVKLRLAEFENERRKRELDRQMGAAENESRKAYYAAREARNKAASRK